MKEFKIGAAVVRIHTGYDKENVKAASEKFMKKVIQCRKEKSKTLSC